MKDHRGIVVDVIDKNLVLVLKPCGDIEKVYTNGRTYEIGDDILFYETVETKKVVDWKKIVRYMSGVAAALLLFFMSPLSLFDKSKSGSMDQPKNAYAATVYIESKANVKADIDTGQIVLDADPLNKPAKKVLSKMDQYKDHDVSEFVKEYFEAAKETGYLGQHDKAIISVVPKIKGEKDVTIKEIKKAINESVALKENGVQVLTVTIPEIVVDKANKLGLTPGKFAILLTAAVSGDKVPSIQKLKVATVTEILNELLTVRDELPKQSEEQLKQLVDVELPKLNTGDSQQSETQNSQSIPSQTTGTDSSTSSQQTQSAVSEPTNGAQPSDGTTASDSTSSTQSNSEGSMTSSTNESTTQPESQTQEGQDQGVTTDNPQTTTEQPTSDQQPQQSTSDQQPTPDQQQTSDQQPSDEKPSGGEQPSDSKSDNPTGEQQDNQQHNEDPQQQDQQGQGEENSKPDSGVSTSAITAVFEWIKNVLS